MVLRLDQNQLTMKTIIQPAKFQNLKLLRDFIEEECMGFPQVDEQTLLDLKLATDEACTNIILHGYAGMRTGTITLGCKVDGDRVILQISDSGYPFELGERSKPDIENGLEDSPLGGFGVYFIYQTMDEVIYEVDGLENCLTMVKKLKA